VAAPAQVLERPERFSCWARPLGAPAAARTPEAVLVTGGTASTLRLCSGSSLPSCLLLGWPPLRQRLRRGRRVALATHRAAQATTRDTASTSEWRTSAARREDTSLWRAPGSATGTPESAQPPATGGAAHPPGHRDRSQPSNAPPDGGRRASPGPTRALPPLPAPTDQPVEVARPAATASAVSYSLAVIRTTPASKSALAFPGGSICVSTALIGTGGSHSST
jgi:hypothetical protein